MALLKSAGRTFSSLTVISVGLVPRVVNVIVVLGLPYEYVVKPNAPVRFTLPTTSAVPEDVPVLGIVKTIAAPVVRSELSVNKPGTVAFVLSVTIDVVLVARPI